MMNTNWRHGDKKKQTETQANRQIDALTKRKPKNITQVARAQM